MHSDVPDWGCCNLIYDTCSASDVQPTGSGQEVGLKVCVCVCVSVCVCVCVCLGAFPLFLNMPRESLCVCVLECVSLLDTASHDVVLLLSAPSHQPFVYVVLFVTL